MLDLFFIAKDFLSCAQKKITGCLAQLLKAIGIASALGPLQAHYLANSGAESHQEFLTLTLKPSFAATRGFCVKVRSLGPALRIILLVWVRIRATQGHGTVINVCTVLR